MSRQRAPSDDKLQAFKNLFSKSKKGIGQDEDRAEKRPDANQLLVQTQAVLEKLRNIDARDPEAFPLLNECTRCGKRCGRSDCLSACRSSRMLKDQG
jgi:hypothetical protein